MNTTVELTPSEIALLVKIARNPDKKIVSIQKSGNEFRVYFKWMGGSSSSAICYNLMGCFNDCIADIKRLERTLSK